MTCTRVSPSWSKSIAIVLPRRNEYRLLTALSRSTLDVDVDMMITMVTYDDISLLHGYFIMLIHRLHV